MTSILILSGGLDSTTLLYKLLNENKEIQAITFNYGQKAQKEINQAKKICEKNNIKHMIIDIKNIFKLLECSSLIDEENTNLQEKKDTMVPSRNTILLELATAYAISINADEVYYGAIKDDIGDYPDTTPIFLEKINDLNKVNNLKYIPIHAPFITYSKEEIIQEALKLNVPINETWSCYSNLEEPCGKCISCISRDKAISQIMDKIIENQEIKYDPKYYNKLIKG